MAFLSNLEMGRGCGAAIEFTQIKYKILVDVHPQSAENVTSEVQPGKHKLNPYMLKRGGGYFEVQCIMIVLSHS